MILFDKINKSVAKLYHKQIDARGLALFRIVYSIVLLFFLSDLYYYHHLIFDAVPYIDAARIPFGAVIGVWALAAVCMMLGLFSRISAVVSYLCTLLVAINLHTFINHLFITFLEVNFLLMFLPVSRVWSVDRWWRERRQAAACQPRTVSAMAYLLPVFFTIGLVYFESTFYKLSDPYWRDGLGSWGPASISIATISKGSWILNSELLEKALGYFTLVFEVAFVFLMWSRRLRWLCFISGMGLHAGILLAFPIPMFAWVMMALYLLVLPVGVYRWLDKLTGKPTSPATAAPPQNVAGKKVWRNLSADDLKLKLVTVFLYSTILLQGVIAYNSNIIIDLRVATDFIESDLDDRLSGISDGVATSGTLLMGLTRNHLFTSDYLRKYEYITRICYVAPDGRETGLPLTDIYGMPGAYNRNMNWGNWSFIVCNPRVSIDVRNNGLRSYTAFWAYNNNIALGNARFKIYTSPLELPTHWEKDFLQRQIAGIKWTEAGSITWNNGQCEVVRLFGF